MDCAPGVPLSELFGKIGSSDGEERIQWMSELKRGVEKAAEALAELHMASAVLPTHLPPPPPLPNPTPQKQSTISFTLSSIKCSTC